MKRVEIRGAAPIREEIIEPVEIVISGSFPDEEVTRLDDLGGAFERDAKKLFDALVATLPRGTFIRLAGMMLQKEAQDCYLIIPHEPAPGPATFSALARIAAWDFNIQGDCVAEARALARAAIATPKGDTQ